MPSYKDIIRSLSTCLKDTSQIDEQRTQQTINLVEAYVDYQRASPADADSPATLDKFSADLGTLYHQELHANDLLELVSERSAANLLHAKHAFFLRVLHGLVPALTPARLIADWWDSALRPVLSSSHYTQEVVHECRSIVTDMLAGDDLPGIDFRSTIVELYLHQNTRPARTLGGINATAEAEEQLAHELQTVYAHLLENDWHRNLAAILMNLGAVKTKDFFILLNAYYIQSQYRLQVLYMLSEFIRRKRTHIHDMLDTPLFESILKSLMLDNSTTLIAISVTTLIMLLPRICTSLPRFLPRLFYIFARAICWDQLRDSKKRKDDRGFDEDPNVVTQSDSDVAAGDGQQGGGRAVPRKSFIVDGWDCLDYSVSKLSTPPSNPRTGPLFTCLYGLYPCNFVAFLHSPLAYLSKSEFKALEEFDERSFRTRTMPIVNRHMLHPNLVLMDETTELTDTSRWMKMEPPDVMAQCMSLDLTNAASRAAYDAGGATCKKEYEAQVWAEAGLVAPEVGPYMDAEGEEAEGEEASWKDKTVSEKEKDMSKQSEKEFTVREHGGATAVTMEEIIAVHKALKSGAEVAVGDDAWQSRMPTAATTTTFSSISASKPTVAGAVDVAAVTTASDYDRVLIASLEREVLLLRNELNFELFLRQQHLQHIGRLYREHMTDSSVEATREQLFNMNVMLRDSLKNLQAKYDQQSKEAASIKEKHLRWENDLQTKVKQYREDKKERVKDMERITEELREAKVSCIVGSVVRF
ncbi:Hamartin protein-domain-containing protein [Jimgerdemannia flammicorona]|uniref:Hamartin protein-domain-containing protein n=1 Tax=Jimgerdemannia flammicorona TaxID=994334 RepID=A0A433D0V5_9FUNG|nr:Hamartin protein-domain-containing protein [Jimgerdemannia flammicorona]